MGGKQGYSSVVTESLPLNNVNVMERFWALTVGLTGVRRESFHNQILAIIAIMESFP
jgi:hypothetical protein